VTDDLPESGRYEILEELGQGGMAVVYRARDRTLGRDVALKILRHEYAAQPSAVSRIVREARAIAALDHPNIVRIYDAVEGERPYLVMELVRGRTLDAALPELPLRERASVVERAARAVHAAHGRGVLHRDLKPSNVMLDADGRVVVMDFGLARIEKDARLTRPGAVVGTPLYMAPEQARGDHGAIDSRTDVYALGVMLYQAVAGRAPWSGSVSDVYRQIATAEPPPLRSANPDAPAELETICARAMAKGRGDRYATAEALAGDLRRFLAGEAIEARPLSAWTRVGRHLGRRRRIVAVSAGACALVAAAAALWTALHRAEERLGSAEESLLREMRMTAQTCLDAALVLRRTGDVGAMNRHAERMEAACSEVERRLPASPEPHHLRGRMLRARMRFDEAMREQERALEKDRGHAGARFERGLLALRRYDDRIEVLRERWRRDHKAGEGRSPARRDLEDAEARSLRERALEDLGAGGASLGAAFAAWLRGEDGQRALFERAIAEPSDSEVAYEWLGRLCREANRIDEAHEWYTRGIARDRGYVPHFEGRARVEVERAIADLREGKAPWARFESGIRDFDEAERLMPDRARTHQLRGHAWMTWGGHRSRRGEDPAEQYRRAQLDLDRAIELSPGSKSFTLRGTLRMNRGLQRQMRGDDPSELYRAAVEDFDAALSHDARDEEPLEARSTLYTNWGVLEAMRRRDPSAHFERAIRDLDEAVRLAPARHGFWMGRASARVAMANAGLGAALALYRAAVEDLDEAIRLAPWSDEALQSRGNARLNWGNHLAELGEDPVEVLRAAIADFEQSIELNRGRDEPWAQMSNVRIQLGMWAQRSGKDASAHFEEAVANAGEAIRINPSRHDHFFHRGNAWSNLGNQRAMRGGDAPEAYGRAVDDYTGALGLNARDHDTLLRRGVTRVNWGSWRVGRGHDPSAQFRDAISDFDAAAPLRADGDASLHRARARLGLAMWAEATGGDPSEEYRAGIADAGEAVKRAPASDAAWAQRGAHRYGWLYWLKRRSPESAEIDGLYAEGCGDYREAIRLNPRNAAHWHQLARTHAAMDRWKEAADAAQEAIKIHPSSAARVKPLLDEARRKLGE